MAAVILATGFSANADNYSQTIADFKSSPAAKAFFNKAYGYAVYPTIGKGGLGIGVAHGKGLVYKKIKRLVKVA